MGEINIRSRKVSKGVDKRCEVQVADDLRLMNEVFPEMDEENDVEACHSSRGLKVCVVVAREVK
jgi:hypothetical protein